MTARSERFTTPSLAGVFLHALHRGDASRRPLVLLHGGGANAHWWDHLAPAFANRFHVVALDFRGHGDSDHPASLEVGAFARDLEALLQHLGAREPALMGHSMGGHIALDHAARKNQVRALVAIEVVRGAPSRERRAMRLALAARRTYRTREDAIARYRFLPPAPHASESLRESIAAHSVARDPDGRFGFKFDPRWFGLPPSERVALGGIRCPTLILRGAESPLLSAEGAAAFAAEIPGARTSLIEAAGHNLHLDQPEAFLAAVQPFLLEHG
ncbi:MAG: alpha/beta fold hydrolase [Candidatus Limnocylindria bacterium]